MMEFDLRTILTRRAEDLGRSDSNSLIILNQPLNDWERFKTLWHNTSYHICADGGANRLLELVTRNSVIADDHQDYLPDLVHGDLDSISPETDEFYRRYGVPITRDDDQYCTDFQKCMLVLTKSYKSTNRPHLNCIGPERPLHQRHTIIVLSTMAGRIDQAIGLLHELLRETKSHPEGSDKPLTLHFVSEQSISFVLPLGRNVIRGIDPKNGIFRKHAGILPIYGPASITLQGFEWDVEDWKTEMGGMVSSSNHVLGNEVVVDVKGTEVLFTIELADSSKA